jgi:dipeptidyl aminopeptidase/acylaminoacyl peptidase
VVTASGDGTARVWDATTGEPITSLLKHKSAVQHAAFSPDGRRVVTASKDRTARVWDAATGEPLGPALQCDTYVWRAEFSPDGQRILTASGDSMARVWYLTQDNRPAQDLSLLAQLLDGRQLDTKSDPVALEPEVVRKVWYTLKSKYPENFAVSPKENLLWHRQEADKDEAAEQWFAARFHLDRLVEALPSDQSLKARRVRVNALLDNAQGK